MRRKVLFLNAFTTIFILALVGCQSPVAPEAVTTAPIPATQEATAGVPPSGPCKLTSEDADLAYKA